MRISFKYSTIPWKTIIIILIGLTTAVWSAVYLRSWVSTHQEMISVPVPAHDIASGTIVAAGDLTTRQFVKQAFDPMACSDIQEIVGKMAVVDLYAGEMIRRDKMIPPVYALNPDEVFVTVKANKLESVLGGKLQVNMVVDVLFNAGSENPPVLLGSDALVVSITNEQSAAGQSLEQQLQQQGANTLPLYVMLKIKKSESFNFARPLSGGEVYLVQKGWRQQVPESPQQGQEQTEQLQQQPEGEPQQLEQPAIKQPQQPEKPAEQPPVEQPQSQAQNSGYEQPPQQLMDTN